MTEFHNRIDLEEFRESAQKFRDEIGKVIVGQEKMIDLMLMALLADGHVLIEGVPGVAKTLAAKLMARCLSVRFSRIQFTPDLMPSDVLGTNIFNLSKSAFEFNRGPVFSNVVLIDEINRAPAKTQSALFEVMEERQVTLDGKTWPMEQPFIVMATQNPIEHEGTYRLPEAQLDRFLFKILVDYPSIHAEEQIIQRAHERKNTRELDMIEPVLRAHQIIAYQELVKQVLIDPNLISYIAQLVTKTRNHPSIFLGASPRASVLVMAASKACAALQGRDFVIPDDIREILVPALNHRLLLTPEKEMEGATTSEVIKQIIQSVEVPK
jgi:MoxR-like ATPase